MSLTNDDLKSIKSLMDASILASEKRMDAKLDTKLAKQDAKLDHAIDVLEQKIETSAQNLRIDLTRYIDKRTDDVLRVLNRSFSQLEEEPALQNLNQRVARLETAVFPKQ